MRDLEPLQQLVLVLSLTGYRVPRCRRRAAQVVVDRGLAEWRGQLDKYDLHATALGVATSKEPRT